MTSGKENEGGIVILAAGSSARLGFPKQTLTFHNKSLLQNTIDEAIKTTITNIVVVLGAKDESIRKEINFKRTEIVVNNDWKDGLASSVICGLHYLQHNNPKLQFVIFLVCDQPFLKADIIQSIIEAYTLSEFALVASTYAGISGTPALFDKKFFPEISELKGDVGAMKIIRKNPDQTFAIPFDQGIIDIDTPEDLQKYSAIE